MTALSKNALHPKCQDLKGTRTTLQRSQDTHYQETANCAVLAVPHAPNDKGLHSNLLLRCPISQSVCTSSILFRKEAL